MWDVINVMMLKRSVLVLPSRCSMTDFCEVMLIYTDRTSVSGCRNRSVLWPYIHRGQS